MNQLSDYTKANTYSQLYYFAYLELKFSRNLPETKVKIIQEIKNLHIPEETKIFMIGVIEDAFINKPKYSNWFSMIVR